MLLIRCLLTYSGYTLKTYTGDGCLACMIGLRHVAIDTTYQRFHNARLT